MAWTRTHILIAGTGATLAGFAAALFARRKWGGDRGEVTAPATARGKTAPGPVGQSGAARSALFTVLPHCLCEEAGVGIEDRASVGSTEPPGAQYGVAFGRRVACVPCGSDPVGVFGSCGNDGNACSVIGCPGTALGWQRNARPERWMRQS